MRKFLLALLLSIVALAAVSQNATYFGYVRDANKKPVEFANVIVVGTNIGVSADPNVTTLVDFESKWKDMVEQGTPVPTPATAEYKDKVGVYEGAGYMSNGLYRPMQDCLMNHFQCDAFCPVCQRAIVKMIEFYCK